MLARTRLGQRNTLLLGYAAMLLAAVGCQFVAGIEKRTLDPIPTSCTLPSGGGGPQVRVANLVPTTDAVDVCIRPAGAASWGRPILLNDGADCASTLGTGSGPAGFLYGNVSVPFTAPAASVDVKFIAAGSTCDAGAVSEGDGLALATNAVTSLLHVGGNGVSTQVAALPEADNTSTSGQRLRLVHAAPGTGAIDFGITKDGQPPTTVVSPLLSVPVQFGGTEPSSATTLIPSATLGDNGYLSFLTGAFFLGASLDGDASKKALFAFNLASLPSQGGNATYSVYAVGVSGDNQHPLQALACDEDPSATGGKNPLLVPCTSSPLPSISVDVFNPALYGPNSPYFVDRQQLVPAAIGKRDSDIMCLVEVDQQVDRDNIIGAAKQYAYNYTLPTTLDTQPTNPADQSGKTPPAPTSPPCSGVSSDLINSAISCAEQSCSTQGPGDGTGVLKGSTDCLVQNCAAPLISVQGQNVACYDCLVVYIASDTSFEATQNNCTTDTRPPMGFSGEQNSMIMSRYPLQNMAALVLPSTFYRRMVLYAQVQLEDQSVDFYCGFLMTTLNAQALPYVGNYGVGPLGDGTKDSETGWRNEQLWEAQQLVNWVGQKSPSNPAIIVGDWRSSKAAPSGTTAPSGTFLPADLAPDTMGLFAAQSNWTFVFDQTPGTSWGYQCSYCPSAENPMNANESFFVEQPMLANWPGNAAAAVRSESLIYNQGVFTPTGVTLDGGQQYPVSPYYGVNFTVIRPH